MDSIKKGVLRSMLDAQSTFAEIYAEYMNCASYDMEGDVAKAKRFVVACRFMLNPLFIQDEHRHAGESSRIEFARIQKQLDDAISYVAENDESVTGVGDPGVIYSSFENYRT